MTINLSEKTPAITAATAITLTITRDDEQTDTAALIEEIAEALKAAGVQVEGLLPELEAMLTDALAGLGKGFGIDFGGLAPAFADAASKFGAGGASSKAGNPASLEDMFGMFDFSQTDMADHLPDRGEVAGGFEGAVSRIGDAFANTTGSTPGSGNVDWGKIGVGLMMADSGATIGTAGGAATASGVGAAAGASLVVVGGTMVGFGLVIAVDGTGLYDALGDDIEPKEAKAAKPQTEQQTGNPSQKQADDTEGEDQTGSENTQEEESSTDDDDEGISEGGQSNEDGTHTNGQSKPAENQSTDETGNGEGLEESSTASNQQPDDCEDPDDDGAPTEEEIAKILEEAANPTGGAGDPEDDADDFFVFDNMGEHVEDDLNGRILTDQDKFAVAVDPTAGPSYDDMVGQPASPAGQEFIDDAFLF